MALLWLVAPARAQLSTLETEDLRLVYIEPLQSYLAPHVARCAQNSIAFQQKLFDFQSDEKITVILTDFSDYGNAGAGAVPRNGVALSIAPMNLNYETYPANERMNTLMNHELVHVAQFDRTAGWDGFFRGMFFGKVPARADHPETILYNYLTSPRSSAPRWFHEGIAVFVETWMAGGVGRAQGSYDEMVFRAMVADDARFYDPLGLVAEATQANFQLESNSYLYGTRFMSWVCYEYGPEKLLEWVTRVGGTRGYFSRQFSKTFGRSLDDAWASWVAFEREWQGSNLERIREFPITRTEDIGARSLGSVSRAHFDEKTNTLYAALNYPGRVAHLAAIDVATGEMRRLRDIKDPITYSVSSLAFDPESRTLFYTRDHSALRDIVAYELETGDARTLLPNARVGDLAFDRSDRSLWGVRHDNGMATIVRMPHPYEEWNQVRTFRYGNTVYDLDVSEDGERIAFGVVAVDGRGEVQVALRDSLLAGSTEAQWRFDFGTTPPGGFVFEPGGETLLGNSYLTGVSNLFRYDLRRDAWDALTNTETGLFRAIPRGEGRAIAFRYTGEGFRPVHVWTEPLEDVNAIQFLGASLRRSHSALAGWKADSPAKIPLDELQTYRGPYRAWRSIELESLVPVVEGYKDYAAVGLRGDWSDPISLHEFAAAVTYTPDSRLDESERLHAELSYERHDARASFRYNDADFYDLFGPTKSSRKGYAVSLGWSKPLLRDLPRELDFNLDVSYWGGLESTPDYQNVSASFEELLSASARLSWRNRSFSIGAVDYEKGSIASLYVGDNHVNGRSFVRAVGTLDLGVPLFAHSSVWLRGAAGYAPDERSEPFANFFFGGFGNNWVDHLHPKRYREWSSFPGFELNEVGGTNFTRAMVDWNLPPLRFSRLGRPSFYAQWARASVFATALATNLDHDATRREVASIGAQIDLRLKLLSHLDWTASVGYAQGFEEGALPREEWMLSLKLF